MTPYSPEGRHGTLTGYVYGCRCSHCTAAMREYNRTYYLNTRPIDWQPKPRQQPKPQQPKRTLHMHAAGNKPTPTYISWCRMKGRCLNPNEWNYHRYGGRGITICDRWLIFDHFLADLGPRPQGHTLDRINPDGNYEPGNVRWATPAQQRHNQRVSQTL